MEEEEYPSDSDQSDEDYKPDEKETELLSEAESDGEPEDDAADDAGETTSPKLKGKSRKRKATNLGNEQPSKKVSKEESTRDEGDDDDKARADALWADFLSGTDDILPSKSKSKVDSTAIVATTTTINSRAAKVPETKAEKPKLTPPEVKKQTVKEIFEFAGERIEVEKSIEAPIESSSTVKLESPEVRRPRVGGLSSVLGQIGKKNKLSILEKTKLDWTGFKRTEGIDEELQIHNKGRGGFLERQDFLQRTDLRQFEIEKNMRAVNRKKTN